MSERPTHENALHEGPALPCATRSPPGLEFTAAVQRGRFELQVCDDCGAVQYPPREACHRCLSTVLSWRPQPEGGELISETTLHHSHEPYFRERLPLRIGVICLDCGPTAIAYVDAAAPSAPCRVRVAARLDESGQAVLVAISEADAVAGETAATSAVRDVASGAAEEPGERHD